MFNSWQSDSPKGTNRRRIAEALAGAKAALEDEFEADSLEVDIDEATRNVSGSPNIPQTIMEKIRIADVFVANITTINPDAPLGPRRVPNPNVVFELGYAVSRLGWHRVILLFNEGLGSSFKDIPFDIDRHWASNFRIESSATRAQQRTQTASLQMLLTTALRSVIVNNPPRADEEGELSREQRNRKNDVAALRDVFGTLNLPTLDRQIEVGPEQLPYEILQYHAGFEAVVSSTLFYLHDTELRRRLAEFHRVWSATLSHGSRYAFNRDATMFLFIRGRTGLTRAEEKEWNKILSELQALRRAVNELVSYVRDHYFEVEINALSTQAFERLKKFEESAVPIARGTGTGQPAEGVLKKTRSRKRSG